MSLPNSLSVSRSKQSSIWSKTTIYHLNAGDTAPLYTLKEAVTWLGKTVRTLHPGSTPDETSIISTASGNLYKTKNNNITISASVGSIDGNDTEVSEPFNRRYTLTHETWDFVIAIGRGSKKHVEKFEWRRSHGTETAGLRSGKGTYGWKLVRLSSDEPTGAGGKSGTRLAGETSDGKEVVAVWADDVQTWFRGEEKGVVGKFEFLGSGAVDGEDGLGAQWKIYAVMSALHIRLVGRQESQSAVTASSSAASTSAT